MPNTWFQFKHFNVNQDKTAMKVCTDACLFGAWTAEKLESEQLKVENALDIGAGTGLLSLMLAQKTAATIDAVEIDTCAAEQAADNFQSSPWQSRLKVIKGDIRNLQLEKKYDLIISNPPFFENDLKSADPKRNTALHSVTLNLETLADTVVRLMTPNGAFTVLLPFHRAKMYVDLAAQNGLYLQEIVSVKQTEQHACFRSMLWFSKSETETKKSEIIIKNNGQYSDEFVGLLKGYYLYL